MTARPNVRRAPAGRAATRAEFANRHKPVTVWLTNEEHADVVRHVARRRVADPYTRASVSGVLRELAITGLRGAVMAPVVVATRTLTEAPPIQAIQEEIRDAIESSLDPASRRPLSREQVGDYLRAISDDEEA